MNPEKRREKKLAERKASKDRDGQHQRESDAARRSSVSHTEVSILREVAHIIERATRREGRVVVIGELVLRKHVWPGSTAISSTLCLRASCLGRDKLECGA